MPFEELMGVANRLLVSAQALAALAARLQLDQLGAEGDPAVRAQLERIVDALGVRADVESLAEPERQVVLAFARSYLSQALDLVEEPERAGAWSYAEPVLLRAQGSASAVVARLIAEAGLGSPGMRVLDVGTGVAGLAIAFCTTFPGSTVVGVDPWAPALAIARENVAEAGLQDRIELVDARIESFEDAEGFDLVWLPSFFIPEAVLDDVLERCRSLLRPGGTLVFGAPFSSDEDPLAAAVDDLFTVRSGGSVVSAEDAVARLGHAGFERVAEVERGWQAPLRLVAAHAAST